MPIRPPIHNPHPHVRREKKVDPFYLSPEWKAFKKRMSSPSGNKCVKCGGAANHLDHITPRKCGGAALDPRNVQWMCARCHNQKTATRDGGFGNRIRS
jgi:5-methylcytosine-specific restriction protein A